jgi:hypothetical protein
MERKCFERPALETDVKDGDEVTAACNTSFDMFCTSKEIVVGFVSNFIIV